MDEQDAAARGLPKYRLAYDALLGRLTAGRYPVGSRLPTEEELARIFAVSRVTIRRSLDMLVGEGFLERRQGSGYTVLSLAPPSSVCLASFTEAMLRAGREPASRLIGIATFEPGAPQAASVIAELQGTRLTCVERVRLVDGAPRMLVRTWAPERLLPGARAEDFPASGPGQSILHILRRRFGLAWTTACEDISPVAASPGVAGFLGVAPGTPLLLQTCTAYDAGDGVVFHEQVFRLGKISFSLAGGSRAAQ
jgi:DNA-binding GntR family transcriptional regulator